MPHVFICHGRAINGKKSFASAAKRTGFENLRFPGLRHTVANHLVMRGRSLKDVQELLGYKTITMTLLNPHLSQKHKKTAVNSWGGRRPGRMKRHGQIWSEFPKQGDPKQKKVFGTTHRKPLVFLWWS
ncbi:MAG: tyrosine-type recombinase/integrase [Deltaproteobacteria bacterium]|nr:tyrosine-type recombinase/integrase [Deltaproteobacteria bacterium]MBW2132113.1 tyrosine-type recombinase/integrase [Deltaproteobacteria bacterium]